jgi:hypothetical protein
MNDSQKNETISFSLFLYHVQQKRVIGQYFQYELDVHILLHRVALNQPDH